MMRDNRIFKLFSLALTVVLLCSCAGVGSKSSDKDFIEQNEPVVFSVVTAEEYSASSEAEKELYDKLDAAVAALDRLHDKKYFAIVTVSNGEKQTALFANTILISKEKIDEEAVRLAELPRCKLCDRESALEWLKEQLLKNDEFGIYVKREGDCVVLVCDKD